MFSEYEKKIIGSLKKEFGELYESMEEEIIMEKIEIATNLYDTVVVDYRINQSAKNYNLLTLAMLSLQYWTQKRVRFFSTKEEF